MLGKNFICYIERDEFLIQRSRQNYYFQGSRPSHLLALRLCNSEKCANITAAKSQTGEFLTDQKSINDTFRSIYCDLYSSNSKCEPTSYTSFLSTLSESDSESFARHLSLIELESSIKVMSKGKSPDLDGIPVEFYLTFWSDLSGPFYILIYTLTPLLFVHCQPVLNQTCQPLSGPLKSLLFLHTI